MVSILPNSQLYNLTYKFERPKKVCEEIDVGGIYDVLKKDSKFSKTVELIDRGGLKARYKNIISKYGMEAGGMTLFVTDDSNIPNSFLSNSDKFKSEAFIRSYTLNGVADIKYLVKNGTTVYKTLDQDNPILCVVKSGSEGKLVEISINHVGRVVKEIRTGNGNIIVLDNIANVGYIN
jgi:hypothetical protein